MVNSLHPKQLLITAALLLVSISSLAYDFEVDGIYYNKLSENTVEVTCEKMYGSNNYEEMSTVTIPSSVIYEDVTYTITAIGESAFCYCSGLMSIYLPDVITSIGNSAFSDCDGLTSIDIPNSVTSIGQLAFFGCSSLTSINIPDGVTSIGYCAFWDCI